MIIVSAQGPNPSFFLFFGTFIQLGGLLGPGLGPGLDNFRTSKMLSHNKKFYIESESVSSYQLALRKSSSCITMKIGWALLKSWILYWYNIQETQILRGTTYYNLPSPIIFNATSAKSRIARVNKSKYSTSACAKHY